MNDKEVLFSSLTAGIGTLLSYWLGGWDAALKALIAFMVLDYVTGFLGAVKQHRVSSDTMFWGGIRKGIILAVIIVAVLLDKMVGNSEPIVRTLVIYFYVAREGVSVTENMGILGVPIPPILSQVLAQLQDPKKKKK